MTTAIADEAAVARARTDADRAEYLRAAREAAAAGASLEIASAMGDHVGSWAVDPAVVEIGGDAMSFEADGRSIRLVFAGPGTPAILPSLRPMDAAWRRCETARREMRRIGWDDAGERMMRVRDDQGAEELAYASRISVNRVGMFPPSVLGVEWAASQDPRSTDDALSVHCDGRTLVVA